MRSEVGIIRYYACVLLIPVIGASFEQHGNDWSFNGEREIPNNDINVGGRPPPVYEPEVPLPASQYNFEKSIPLDPEDDPSTHNTLGDVNCEHTQGWNSNDRGHQKRPKTAAGERGHQLPLEASALENMRWIQRQNILKNVLANFKNTFVTVGDVTPELKVPRSSVACGRTKTPNKEKTNTKSISVISTTNTDATNLIKIQRRKRAGFGGGFGGGGFGGGGFGGGFGGRFQEYDGHKIATQASILLSNLGQNVSKAEFESVINEIQHLYCPRATCGREPKIDCGYHCDRCNCDDYCTRYGSCCTDETFQSPEMSWTCVSLDRKNKNVSGVYMVGSCPDAYFNDTIKTNCESNEVRTLPAILPVYNNSNTYKNRYCAMCHGVTQFLNWQILVVCADLLHIPSSMLYNEAYGMIIDEWPCKITVIMPQGGNVDSPDCVEKERDVFISECNVTGEWDQYDPNIEKACQYYTLVFDDIYKNVFCFLCNTDNRTVGCLKRFQDTGITFTSFSKILNFNIDDPSADAPGEIECKRGFQYDKIQGDCIEIYCAPGKWYNGSRCETVAVTAQDIERNYLADMMLKPSNPVNYSFCLSSTADTDLLLETLQTNLTDIETLIDSLIEEMKDVIKSQMGGRNYFSGHKVSFKLIELTSHEYFNCLTDAESTTIESLGIRRVLHGFWTMLIIKGYSLETSETVDEKVRDFLSVTPIVETPQHGNISFSKDENATYYLRKHSHPLIDIHTMKAYLTYKDDATQFSKLRHCPYVTINMTNCRILDDGKLLEIKLKSSLSYQDAVRRNGVLVGYEDFEIIDETIAHICQDAFYKLQQSLEVKRKEIISDYVEGILSLVCTCLSIICLLLTVLVYCILKSLRSVPGLNNMSLSVTLIIAQALFQFGANQTEFNVLCKIIGVVTHYIWLSVVLWMNVCSFHMFKVFGFLSKSAFDSNSRSVYAKYIVYCFTLPSLCVGANIVASLLMSDMENIGYGQTICYIHDRLLLGLTFALPVGLVILSNISMFLMVVVSIYRQASASSFATSDRQYLNVYFRLSTITGVTWLFGFIYQWSGTIVFSYLFIIFNAAQGVFIFLAFVASRRVLGNLKVHFTGGKNQPQRQLALPRPLGFRQLGEQRSSEKICFREWVGEAELGGLDYYWCNCKKSSTL